MLKTIISIFIISLISISYANKSENIAALYGIQFSDNFLTIQVASNGCTRVDDFEIHEKLSLDIHYLSIIRVKKDRCRAMSREISLDIPFETDNKKTYKVTNEFSLIR